MEPALDERGDRRGPATAAHRTAAAMEPVLDERGDLGGNVARLDPGAAAMEPALDERGDQAAVPMWIAEVKPQWSPLSTSGATTLADPKDSYVEPVPQWSPLSTSGATDRRTPAGRAPSGAAMEPALDERGDSETSSES